MDEYDHSGMGPEVRKYFRKIMNSFSVGALWLLVMATSGIFFRLAIIDGVIRWYNVLFYLVFIVSLAWLIRYFYKTWNEK